jgi:hypothetical protein
MAGFFQDLLGDATKAFFGNDYLRDYTHASLTFRSNAYQYSPKFKFLFHVYFDINTEYISTQFPQGSNFGLAVKNIQLPKYTVDVTTLNQYNRKRLVQTKLKYDPINIVFHDDNGNLIRNLWNAYYTYYYKDGLQIDSFSNVTAGPPNPKFDLNKRNVYDSSISGNDDWGYIGESSRTPVTTAGSALGQTKAPFFRAINIYGFNQHNFALYRLINPMIESFSHDTYDYSQSNGVMENQMSIAYETVNYFQGAIDGRRPDQIVKQFGVDGQYDRTLSPIARPGSNAAILGPGGLLDAAGGILENLESGNILGAIQKAGAAKNTFKNPQNIVKIATAEALGMANTALQGSPNRNTQFTFPTEAATFIKGVPGQVQQGVQQMLKKPPTV